HICESRPRGQTRANAVLSVEASPRALAHPTAHSGWRTAMLLLNNDDVAKVLDMRVCLDALDGMFAELAKGEAVGMGRIDLYVPSNVDTAPYYRWAVMTGGSKRDGLVCARMLSDMVAWPREYGRVRENKYARSPGTFCGLLFLFSAADATPVAMINDGLLQ